MKKYKFITESDYGDLQLIIYFEDRDESIKVQNEMIERGYLKITETNTQDKDLYPFSVWFEPKNKIMNGGQKNSEYMLRYGRSLHSDIFMEYIDNLEALFESLKMGLL